MTNEYTQTLTKRVAMARRTANRLRIDAREIYDDLARQSDPDWQQGLLRLQDLVNRRTAKVGWHLRRDEEREREIRDEAVAEYLIATHENEEVRVSKNAVHGEGGPHAGINIAALEYLIATHEDE